jgi:hypothetical protein
MTLPTKFPHRTTKSARKLVQNNKFPIAKLRVPTALKKLNYNPEPYQISRFHHQTRLKTGSSHTEAPSNLPPTAKFATGLYNAFQRQFPTFDTENGKITSDSGLDGLEHHTYNFDPFYRDDQELTYE